MQRGDALAEHLGLVTALGWEEPGLARKRRLYLAAVCRRFWEEMPLPSGHTAIERAAAFADGHSSLAALASAHQAHLHAHAAYSATRGKRAVPTRAWFLSGCALAAADPAGCRLVVPLERNAVLAGTHLLRDVFGPAGSEINEPTPCLTPDVVEIARAIYEEEAFERLPRLAEALVDVGCAHDGILAHCRAAGPHVRGCWVVDTVLGRV